ncbi:flavodoxin family protein [Sutcliffiella deserti]|uniref:flavodoxin family protein n=1 Tax=Sutcliffiella deserti TaxID=2875501 RepID=UPI0021DFF435|nr:flavodoxin family protein [Sutcliffiella deserti]
MIKALFLNCSLKSSEETSNTQSLMNEVITHFEKEGVKSETIRIADYHVKFGISEDEGEGDEWPIIFEKIKTADILVIGTPLWIGEKSSVATMVMERIYGASSLTNEKGQCIYYNKVAGTVVTGNEDGAKHAARSILYGLTHSGFNIPPNVDTYWVGEAGPGDSYIDAEGHRNEFTMQQAKTTAYNLLHFSRMLKENPIPAEGNLIEN